MKPAKFCKQWVVYWAPGARTAKGTRSYSTPIEVKARWDEELGEPLQGVRRELDHVEEARVVDTSVMVDRALEQHGLLKLGRLVDIAVGYTPVPNADGVVEIQATLTNPTINAKDFLYRVTF